MCGSQQQGRDYDGVAIFEQPEFDDEHGGYLLQQSCDKKPIRKGIARTGTLEVLAYDIHNSNHDGGHMVYQKRCCRYFRST